MIQGMPGRVVALVALVLVLGALSGCASTDKPSTDLELAEVEPVEDDGLEVAESVPEPEALAESSLEQLETSKSKNVQFDAGKQKAGRSLSRETHFRRGHGSIFSAKFTPT